MMGTPSMMEEEAAKRKMRRRPSCLDLGEAEEREEKRDMFQGEGRWGLIMDLYFGWFVFLSI